MLLALLVLGLLAAAMLAPLLLRAARSGRERGARRARRRAERRELRDPGRERRAEQRARELLRSCVNEEEWAMYRDLGFIRVAGELQGDGPGGLSAPRRRLRGAQATGSARAETRKTAEPEHEPAYAYLLSPHQP